MACTGKPPGHPGDGLTDEHRSWMPAFLHFYPGLTPASYGDLHTDDWERMRHFLEEAMKGR